VSLDRAVVIRAVSEYTGAQGPQYGGGVSAESVGSTGLWLGKVTIAPGARTRAHLHERHETAIYVLEGECIVYSGRELAARDAASAGEYMYIPANVSHVAVNASATERCVAIITRTDPNEQESVVLQPELDGRVP
jgi:uncharacterized RmlC-like cupin family protein